MANKSAIEKIRNGAGLEDPEVKAYIEHRNEVDARRLEGYRRTNELQKQLREQSKQGS